MAKPTHEDALIMLQLAELGANPAMSEASSWIWSDELVADGEAFNKKYPPGSDGFRKVMMVATHFETIGTLWKNDLFNENLLFDWIAVGMIWDKVKGPLLYGRKQSGNPALWENFEAMAKADASKRK